MTSWVERLRRWFGKSKAEAGAASTATLITLGRAIQTTRDQEFDCDQTNQLLDHFAEAVLQGADPEPWMDLIQAHLERCPDCQAEFEALLHILQTEEM